MLRYTGSDPALPASSVQAWLRIRQFSDHDSGSYVNTILDLEDETASIFRPYRSRASRNWSRVMSADVGRVVDVIMSSLHWRLSNLKANSHFEL